MMQPFENHQHKNMESELLRLWGEWNPFDFAPTETHRYEHLALMTSYALANRPHLNELVNAIKYFIELDAQKGQQPAAESIHEFARLLISNALKDSSTLPIASYSNQAISNGVEKQ